MRNNYLSGIWGLGFFFLFGCGQTQQIAENSEPEIATRTDASTQIAFEEAITEDDISSILKYLSSDKLEGRKTGSEGIEKAADYIQTILRKSGVKPFFETYRDSFQVKGMTGFNVVGLVEGTDPQLRDEYLIIGAHYDHVGLVEPVDGDSIANGANDNAAGTTAVLELAAYFAENPPKRSILFTLFSAEELGLVGAKHLAKKLEREAIDLYVMFNIEMVGVPMVDKDYLVYVTGYERSNLADKFNEYSDAKILGFLPQAKEYNLFRRSDNYPFFERFNVPAQTISTFDFTNYEYYHHVDDEFEEMDLSHLENVIESLIPGLTAMANTPEKEIKMNTK
ncbi:M20/M25/M40 family metallo-hydrolase [Salinimicrobium terrae]|uniref:M20/M25/M40 family metallo-hydrolase n=1 Tax=Salinimicrobium terrae TaxID=470866 RepID=UPI000419BE1F|nr:M20/M25/M40 family metallo-hydrolase [Salinimicrobium terrae]